MNDPCPDHQELLSSRPIRRDWRLDFFRGIALLFIFVDHVDWLSGQRTLSLLTLQAFAVFDAAEVFVFISGYVCGIVYGRLEARSGFRGCLKKALRRFVQVYSANLLTLMLTLNLVFICHHFDLCTFAGFRLDGPWDRPLLLARWIVLQMFQPVGFDILTLYLHLLLVLPFFIAGARRFPRVTWLVIGAIYLVIQFVPQLNYPQYVWATDELSGASRPFNHFAWQLLFCLGCQTGLGRLHGRSGRRSKILKVSAWVLTISAVAIQLAADLFHTRLLPETVESTLHVLWSSPVADKTTAGPLRIAAFLLFTVVVTDVVPEETKLADRVVVRALCGCGQNSLLFFCAGLFLTFSSVPLTIPWSQSEASIMVFEVSASILMLTVGFRRNRFAQAP